MHKKKGEDEASRSKKQEKRPIVKESKDPFPLTIITPPIVQTIIPLSPLKLPKKTTSSTKSKTSLPSLKIQTSTPEKSKTTSPLRQIQTTTTTSMRQEENPLALVVALPNQTLAVPDLNNPSTNQGDVELYQESFEDSLCDLFTPIEDKIKDLKEASLVPVSKEVLENAIDDPLLKCKGFPMR